MRLPVRRLIPGLLIASLAGLAFAQDETPSDATESTGTTESSEAAGVDAAVPPVEFGDDFDAARAAAGESGKPILVVAVPDEYDSPVWKNVTERLAAEDADRTTLAAFECVLLRESSDREIHARHRVAYRGYPLAVVIDAGGDYLGHLSGLPADDGVDGWADALAAVPPRAARIAELREQLDADPDAPAVLFELGELLWDAGEHERADDVLERYERADPLGPPERLGQSRYLRMRRAVNASIVKRDFAAVEGLCLKWRRRFEEHARLPDVLLLQAGARYLNGDHDGAKELWERIKADHAKSDAAKTATEALEKL